MPLYARDIIITPQSGSIIFSGSAEGGLSSSLIVDDSGSLTIDIVENGNLSINGIILATSSMKISGSLETDDLIINNVFTLNGSLDLGSF
tara:strand:- start:1848 stop:2117 length:270 start_codon:yes stop_codon:yes gene_type:complete